MNLVQAAFRYQQAVFSQGHVKCKASSRQVGVVEGHIYDRSLWSDQYVKDGRKIMWAGNFLFLISEITTSFYLRFCSFWGVVLAVRKFIQRGEAGFFLPFFQFQGCTTYRTQFLCPYQFWIGSSSVVHKAKWWILKNTEQKNTPESSANFIWNGEGRRAGRESKQ